MTRIDAQGNIDSITHQIEGILDAIVERKMQTKKLLRSTIQAAIIREEEIEAERQRALEEKEAAEKAEGDELKAEGSAHEENKSIEGGKTGRSAN